MAQLDYPIRPNAKGGFDILLKPTITAPAVSETATPPEMAGAPAEGEQDWMSAVGEAAEAARTNGVSVPAGLNGAQAQYTPPPDMGGGPLSRMLPAGMGEGLASVAGGMNTIERNQSPLAGFAAGLSGAMTARETRRKDKRAEMLADEERRWRQEDRLYNRGIEGEKLGMLKEEHERAGKSSQRDEALDAMSAQVKGLEIKTAEIELDRLANQHGLTVDQSQKAMDQAARLTEAEWEGTTVDDNNRQAFQDSLQRNLQKAIQAAGGGGGGAPVGGAGGTGSQATPIAWSPGAAPRNDAEFKQQMDAAVAANGGQPVWYTNPATGKILPYTGRAGGVGAPI